MGKVSENVLEQGRFRQDLRKRIKVTWYVERQAHLRRAEGDLFCAFCALCAFYALCRQFLYFSTAARKYAGPHLVPSPQQSPDGIFRNKL